MSYQLQMTDIKDAIHEQIADFYSAFHQVHVDPDPMSAAVQLRLPTRFGNGHLNIRKFGTNTFSTMKLNFNRDISLTEEVLDSGYFVSLNLGQSVTFEEGSPTRSYHFPANAITLGYTREGTKLRTMMPSDQQIHSLSFFLSESQLRQYFIELQRTDLADRLLKVTDGMAVLANASISPMQQHLIEKLNSNPHRGSLEQLYFDSVAGELLISLLESICTEHKSTHINLTERDRDLLLVARNLLLQDLRQPPTISQLAKSVGMNEDKLKKGFKVMYNSTIYKTLTEQRMQLAVTQLHSNDMSIAEIAYDAGYENVSKFIAAFRKTYGVTPGMMRKDIKYSLPISYS
jgi:AraC-like DNA-binding protein